jgi:hypothetical protein
MEQIEEGMRVYASPMWKHDEAYGFVKKITSDGYFIIVWDNINGDWYFTPDQVKDFKVAK